MRTHNTISTIIFDLGQVIVKFDHMELCRRASKHSPYPPNEVYRRMFDSGLIARFETGALPPADFYHEACSSLEINLPLEQFTTIWNTIFTLDIETTHIIECLQGFQLLLLSNTNCWHFNYCLEHYPVLRFFNHYVLSYEVGVYKPDKKIFLAALNRASARPRECIFIDDIEQYTKAATSMGIMAHTFTTAANLRNCLNQHNIL